MTVDAEAHLIAKIGFFWVKVRVLCRVWADTIKMLTKPSDVIAEKECSYHYGL